MAQINQVTAGIYRISSYPPTSRVSFNQFLINDEHPTLIHTGPNLCMKTYGRLSPRSVRSSGQSLAMGPMPAQREGCKTAIDSILEATTYGSWKPHMFTIGIP